MQPGTRVGTCEVVREIARGGQGVVYEARDLATGQPRALKVLLENDDEMRARFRHEARALANLNHSGLPRVFDLQERGGAFYMVQELIDGDDLQTLVRARGRFEPERAVEIVRALAETLDYVHSHGLVHRDLKPGNVVLERGTGRVVLLDFGMIRTRLRQAWATQDRASLTGAGDLLGTPAFMAPEQVDRTVGEIDRRTDVYALGSTLFTLLTGSPPLPVGGTVLELLQRVLTEAPPDPRTLVPEVPAHVARVCLRCLAKAPVARPGSAGDVIALLEQEEAAASAAPENPALWLLLAAALCALGGIAAWALLSPSEAPAPSPSPSPEVSPTDVPVEPVVSAATPSPSAEPAPAASPDLPEEVKKGSPEEIYRYGARRLQAEDGGATEAIRWFELAAERGSVPAMNEASRLYEQGLGVLIDQERALQWSKRSANTGDSVGLARYGFALIFGRGARRDEAAGEALLERAGDHPEAFYRRGLREDWRRKRDRADAIKSRELAFRHYQRAGKAGHGDAWSRIAHPLSTTEPFDYEAAFRCYEEGAKLGSAHAIHGLARLHSTRIEGRQREPELTRQLYERSARLGIRDSSANLAYIYRRKGQFEQSRRHAERALSLGQGIGAVHLADIYGEGLGVPRDLRKAWEALLQGARLEDPYVCIGEISKRLVKRRQNHPSDLVEPIRQVLLPFANPDNPQLVRRVGLKAATQIREQVSAALATLRR